MKPIKLKNLMKEEIYVVDERHVGDFLIVMLQDTKTSAMRSAVLKKNKSDKYNRNKQDVVNTLWDLAKKYKGKEITEIMKENYDPSSQQFFEKWFAKNFNRKADDSYFQEWQQRFDKGLIPFVSHMDSKSFNTFIEVLKSMR